MVISWDATNREQVWADTVARTTWDTLLVIVLRAVLACGVGEVIRLVADVLLAVVVVTVAAQVLDAAMGVGVTDVVSTKGGAIIVIIAATSVGIASDTTKGEISGAVGVCRTSWQTVDSISF